MGTIQNLNGDSAGVATSTDPGSYHLLANTGSRNPVLSLNAATSIQNGTTVDFGSAKKTISWQVVPAGAVSTGAVGFQVSADGQTWFNLPVAGAPPAGGLVTLCSVAAANPVTLTTGGQILFTTSFGIAVRYARATITTAVTGTGAAVSVQLSAS